MRRLALVVLLSLIQTRGFAQAPAGVTLELRLAERSPADGLEEVAGNFDNEKLYLHREALVTNKDLFQVSVEESTGAAGGFAIHLVFTREAAQRMALATKGHLGKPMAFLINGKVRLSPVVNSPLSDEAAIMGSALGLSREEAEQLIAGIKTGAVSRALPLPRFTVSGRVAGQPGDVPGSIGLMGDQVFPNAPLRADGSFEFTGVLPGAYTLRAFLGIPMPPPDPSIVVSDRNVAGIQIVVPPMKNVRGRVTVDGQGPMPPLMFEMSEGAWRSGPILVMPEPDGAFAITLPEGERSLSLIALLPKGYSATSVAYGSTNLRGGNTVKMSNADSAELQLNFATTPNAWFRVSGKVMGLDPARTATVTITTKAVFQGAFPFRLPALAPAAVRTDGTFEFPKVLPGTYTLRATTADNGSAWSADIDVRDTDLQNVELR